MTSISAIGTVPKGLILHKRYGQITRKPARESQCFRNSAVSRLKDGTGSLSGNEVFDRREVLFSTIGFLAGAIMHATNNGEAIAAEFADIKLQCWLCILGPQCQHLEGRTMGKQKCGIRITWKQNQVSNTRMQDLRVGSGRTPKMGETVVVDWDGYTIGYYGRIFEARNKTKGGSFEGDEKEFLKFTLGSQQVIPALEEAIVGMAPGGVRRIIVPPELGYPENDFNKKGPRPTTFSGQRALDFVLRNQGLIDKTLLFDIELLKVIPN